MLIKKQNQKEEIFENFIDLSNVSCMVSFGDLEFFVVFLQDVVEKWLITQRLNFRVMRNIKLISCEKNMNNYVKIIYIN